MARQLFVALVFATCGVWWASCMVPSARAVAADGSVAPPAATCEAEPPGVLLTVRHFGARGDGEGDDAPAIQRAIDQGTGGVHLPRGTYRLLRPLVVDLDRAGCTSLVGDGTATLLMAAPGPAIHLRGTHQGSADPASVEPRVWQRQRSPLIDGLEIVGGHPEACGIRVEGTMQPVLTRLTIRRTLDAVALVRRNRNVTVGHCNLYDNRGVGLLLEDLNLHQINVANCHISYNRGGGIVVRRSEIRNFQIGTCDIEANMAADGPPTANVLFDAREGSIREGAIVGCTIQHSHKAPGGANLRFLGNPQPVPEKVGLMAVTANAFSDAEVSVHLRNARGVVLTANTFFEAGQHHLLVERSQRIVVGPNVFDRHPDYRMVKGPQRLEFTDSRDCTLSGLQVVGSGGEEAGVTLRRCRRFLITGCTIETAAPVALLWDAVDESRLTDCVLDAAGTAAQPAIALRVVGGRENYVLQNHLRAGRLEIAPGTAVETGNHGPPAEPQR